MGLFSFVVRVGYFPQYCDFLHYFLSCNYVFAMDFHYRCFSMEPTVLRMRYHAWFHSVSDIELIQVILHPYKFEFLQDITVVLVIVFWNKRNWGILVPFYVFKGLQTSNMSSLVNFVLSTITRVSDSEKLQYAWLFTYCIHWSVTVSDDNTIFELLDRNDPRNGRIGCLGLHRFVAWNNKYNM